MEKYFKICYNRGLINLQKFSDKYFDKIAYKIMFSKSGPKRTSKLMGVALSSTKKLK